MVYTNIQPSTRNFLVLLLHATVFRKTRAKLRHVWRCSTQLRQCEPRSTRRHVPCRTVSQCGSGIYMAAVQHLLFLEEDDSQSSSYAVILVGPTDFLSASSPDLIRQSRWSYSDKDRL